MRNGLHVRVAAALFEPVLVVGVCVCVSASFCAHRSSLQQTTCVHAASVLTFSFHALDLGSSSFLPWPMCTRAQSDMGRRMHRTSEAGKSAPACVRGKRLPLYRFTSADASAPSKVSALCPANLSPAACILSHGTVLREVFSFLGRWCARTFVRTDASAHTRVACEASGRS